MNELELSYLKSMANLLRTAVRDGLEFDFPEGHRFIRLSDTLANTMASRLEQIVFDHGPRDFINDLNEFNEHRSGTIGKRQQTAS